MPLPASATSITTSPPTRRRAQLDAPARRRCAARRSRAARRARARSRHDRAARCRRRPGASTTSVSPMCAQRVCTSASSGVDVGRDGRDVARRGRALEQQQPLQQPRHARELAGDDAVRLLGLLARPGAAAPQHLEVALGDRDRRQHLVRDVGQEDLLPLERGGVLLGQRLGHAHRLLAPLRVEDHGEEHQRHQRHLGLLRPALAAGHDGDSVMPPVETLTKRMPSTVRELRQTRKP